MADMAASMLARLKYSVKSIENRRLPIGWRCFRICLKGVGAYEGIRNKAQTNKILRRYKE